MKHLKPYEKLNENLEDSASCVEFLNYAIETTLGNPGNFEELKNTANSLDAYYEGYHRPAPSEPGWYTKETLTKFKELVKSMLQDETSNYPPDYDFNNEEDRNQISFEEWKTTKKYNL